MVWVSRLGIMERGGMLCVPLVDSYGAFMYRSYSS